MSKLRHFWAILAFIAPLAATKVEAQPFGAPIDLLAPIQEDIIRDLEQNPDNTNSRDSSINSEPVHPIFIKALQECDNDTIANYLEGRKAGGLSAPSSMLQRAHQCGAISSEKLSELLRYQQ